MNQPSTYYSPVNRVTAVLFVIYLIAICWILIFKLGVDFSYMHERRINLVPFRYGPIFNMENVLNVLVFLPLGIYAGALFKKWNYGNQFLFFFLFSLSVEGIQYLLRIGAFDVTDLITNSAGGAIGLVLYKWLEQLLGNERKAQKFVNIIAGTGTALVILLLFFLKMNMLPVRYQ